MINHIAPVSEIHPKKRQISPNSFRGAFQAGIPDADEAPRRPGFT
jgi:hypothetical protein